MPDGVSSNESLSPLDVTAALGKTLNIETVATLREKAGRSPKELTPTELITDLRITSERKSNPETIVIRQRFADRMQLVGGYVANRLDGIGDNTEEGKRAREIAQQFAYDMHGIGVLLGAREARSSEDFPLPDDQETSQIDRLLAGAPLYQSRNDDVERYAELHQSEEARKGYAEAMRQDSLRQYFTLLARSEKEVSPPQEVQMQTIAQLESQIRDPTSFREAFRTDAQERFRSLIENHALATLAVDIFSDETRNLATNLKLPGPGEMQLSKEKVDKIRADLATRSKGESTVSSWTLDTYDNISQILLRALNATGEGRRLENIIGMDYLQQRLAEARRSKDPNEIGRAERFAMYSIQAGVALIPYEENAASDFNRMLEGVVNCVGASNIMGTLLDKVGINHATFSSFTHTLLAVAYSDGSPHLVEPLRIGDASFINDSDLVRTDGTPLTALEINEIIAKHQDFLAINVRSSRVKEMMFLGESEQRTYLDSSTLGAAAATLNNIGAITSLSPEQSLNIGLLEYVINPNNSFALYNLGVSYDHPGRSEEAIATYRESIRLQSDQAIAFAALGNIYTSLGQYEDALTNYQEVLRIDSNKVNVYNNLGIVYTLLERYDEALAAYQESIRLYPGYTGAYYNLGNMLSDLFRYEDAIAVYEQVVQIDPNKSSAYNNMGIAYVQLERYDEALAAYQEAIRLDPNSLDIIFNLGEVYNYLQDIPQASKWFKEFVLRFAHVSPSQQEYYEDLQRYATVYLRRLERMRQNE